MRERKLRSAAESLARMKGSAISCTITLYKTRRESKRKNTIRICSSLESRLKQQWDQMFWPAKKLGCGIAEEQYAKEHLHSVFALIAWRRFDVDEHVGHPGQVTADAI